jgi:ubiquinone/menaquinone biosynthesis C-methylase UbiE
VSQDTGRFSQWRPEAIRGINETAARELSARTLELRGRSEDEVTSRSAYLGLLGIAPGERILEIGCGSGVVLRDLARRVAPGGRAVGLDPSPAMLTVARELAAAAGLAELVELHEGDARSLPFADGAFDAVLAVTALVHIPDVERTVAEMVRVARRGGRVGVFDRDNDTYFISHPDRALTRRIIAAGSEHTLVNPWIARQAPLMLQAHGLRDVRVRAFVSLEQDPAGFYATSASERWPPIAVQVGAITEDERLRWMEQLRAVQASGGFLAGLTHLFTWGTRG